MRRKKYYALINGFTRKYGEKEMTSAVVKEILTEYRESICPALCNYSFKLSRRHALNICDNLGQGNWEKMWLTDEEKAESIDKICRALLWDVYYCSDRMTWDRLTRINWQYQRLLHRMEYENESEE